MPPNERKRGPAGESRPPALVTFAGHIDQRLFGVPAEARAQRAVGWGGIQTTVAVPPAASIFCLADAENPWALTWHATEISPWPSTLTGWPLRTAPLAT